MTTRSRFNAKKAAGGLAWDVAPALAAYYGLHLLGVGDMLALLAATAVATLRTIWVALAKRSVNVFSIVMMMVFGIGLVLSLISGDPRFLLLKGVIMSALGGLAVLGTTTWGRLPLLLLAQQSWDPERSDEIAWEYHTDPDVRRRCRVSSTVWGTALLTDAAIRVPVIYLLPISVMVGLSTMLMVACLGGLIVWTSWYLAQPHRHEQQLAAL